MKRIGLLMAMVAAFSAPSVHAVVDLNGNGMSDVWEQFYQAQGLAANADADGDGQTNLAESIAPNQSREYLASRLVAAR